MTAAAPDAQAEVVAFLSDPAGHGGGVRSVERIETHISVVFLAGDRAYKLKRAVRFSYLDFSTLALRKRACEAEVAINRRTAPTLYRGVVAVTRVADGGLALGGDGPVVEWLVEMARFDQDTLFDRLATRGALDGGLVDALAEAIARFHLAAEPRPRAGGHAGLSGAVDVNAEGFRRFAGRTLDQGKVTDLLAKTRSLLDRHGALLDRRRDEGFVRHCHGDLHLRNICLVEGRPTLFDAIEFNEDFSDIDVMYDLAFLLMDLDHRGLGPPASEVLNRYLDLTGDVGGLAPLPLMLSVRAAVRSHVDATAAARVSDAAQAAEMAAEAVRYLDLARAFLAPPAPRLIAVGGLSGSGKSWLARALAPFVGARPGARVVRTDVVRKRLAGVGLTDRLGADSYAPEMTARTYAAVYAEARAALAAGHAAIADAVFLRAGQRAAVAAVAREAGVPFDGLWVEAPAEVMEHRVSARRGDASDADAAVLRMQLSLDPGRVAWRRIDGAGTKEETLARARAALGL